MSYFNEIADYATYSGNQADFHFTYNANSGGGQAFLGGRFYDKTGQLASPETLNGRIAVFEYRFRGENGDEVSVVLSDDKTKYEIKPRGAGSSSMKLGIGTDRVAPSKVISAFMMLPPTCGVKMPSNLQLSILSSNNYWLQSMWLECNTETETPNEVVFSVKDCIFGGGVSKEATDRTGRYFKLDIEKRMADIIALSQKTGVFGNEIEAAIQLFANVYLGHRQFNYEECNQATQTLMENLAHCFPDVYSGITDPLPVMYEILRTNNSRNTVNDGKVRFKTGYHHEFPRNRILFGAPGTGKSFTMNGDRKELLYGDRDVDEDSIDHSLYGEYERVTFHPDYSYANFVGTYKPVPCKDGDGKDAITYSYVPGPFMRTYVKALQNSRTDTPKPFLLVIEEINRANVAAVFGDVFQLLDRRPDEVSEYPIQASEDIKKFLALPENLGGKPEDYAEIRIPDNMFIWATMNSADQGVFPMDTAFKRRWDFTYLGIDDSEAGIVGKTVILGQGEYRRTVEWNALRKAINSELLTYKVNEDKLMGPYFISKKNLPKGDIIDPTSFTRIFKNKVIMYLFDDAAKQKRPSLFAGCKDENKNLYSQICKEFDTKGVFIFCTKISDRFLPEDDGE